MSSLKKYFSNSNHTVSFESDLTGLSTGADFGGLEMYLWLIILQLVGSLKLGRNARPGTKYLDDRMTE